MTMIRKQFGFTLLEVMAASVIMAFIAMVAVSGMMSVTSARSQLDEVTVVNDELRFVADRIRSDLADFYRNPNIIIFEGAQEDTAIGTVPRLRFWAVCSSKARSDQPEGDLCEVEYFLAMGDNDQTWLARRQCPVVGNEEDYTETDGGVITRLAEDISYFQVRYFNGTDWVEVWPAELEELPLLVEVSLASRVTEKSGKQTVYAKQLFVNFPRNGDDTTASTEEETETEVDLEMDVSDPEAAMTQ